MYMTVMPSKSWSRRIYETVTSNQTQTFLIKFVLKLSRLMTAIVWFLTSFFRIRPFSVIPTFFWQDDSNLSSISDEKTLTKIVEIW